MLKADITEGYNEFEAGELISVLQNLINKYKLRTFFDIISLE